MATALNSKGAARKLSWIRTLRWIPVAGATAASRSRRAFTVSSVNVIVVVHVPLPVVTVSFQLSVLPGAVLRAIWIWSIRPPAAVSSMVRPRAASAQYSAWPEAASPVARAPSILARSKSAMPSSVMTATSTRPERKKTPRWFPTVRRQRRCICRLLSFAA